MEPNELIFEEEARSLLQEGIKKLNDVVGVTLGPKGRHVGLSASWGAPQITSDGNSVAKEVELSNQYQNMGVSIGKEVAQKMKEKCGDGTTSAIVLLQSLVDHGVKSIASGASPVFVKRGMDKALETILKALEKKAIPIKTGAEMESIASASASGNEQVGKIIADAFKMVGNEGVITIEESKTIDTSVEMVEGMQFDRGYLSAYFSTDLEAMAVEMQSPYILVTDRKISSIQEILPLLQSLASTGKEFLIIADDVEGDALSTLVVNKLRGMLKVCAVKAPGFGDRRKEMLEDIATLVGADLVSESTGSNLKDVTIDDLGTAKNALVTKEATTLVGGAGKKEMITARIAQIEAAIEAASSPYDKEKHLERKAKLSGGIAVIRVGGATEPEQKQKKQMFEDSLSSTKAAIEEGILPGGGTSLLRAAKETKMALLGDEMIGAEIVLRACEAPLRQLAKNGGLDPSLIIEEVVANKGPAVGFNAQSEKVEDLFKAGVIDPCKVVKSALTLAVSAAGMILLSEVLIGSAE